MLTVLVLAAAACAAQTTDQTTDRMTGRMNGESALTEMDNLAGKTKIATFGGGCFWCTEAVFARVDGVSGVTSGYTGGHVENPTYDDICSGESGHAEVIRIVYDPEKVTFTELLEIFFATHDPTTLNRQGADVGTQYRSEIFYHDEEQKKTAEKVRAALGEAGVFDAPIVTMINAAQTFYPAEKYHQDYYANNPNAGYCVMVIRPKLEKLEKLFREKLKEE